MQHNKNEKCTKPRAMSYPINLTQSVMTRRDPKKACKAKEDEDFTESDREARETIPYILYTFVFKSYSVFGSW